MKDPEDFINKIYCGNFFEVEKGLPSGFVDLIITSPPYNVGIDYDGFNDCLSKEDYLLFLDEFVKRSKRLLKPDGRFAAVVPGGVGRNPYIPIAYKLDAQQNCMGKLEISILPRPSRYVRADNNCP